MWDWEKPVASIREATSLGPCLSSQISRRRAGSLRMPKELAEFFKQLGARHAPIGKRTHRHVMADTSIMPVTAAGP